MPLAEANEGEMRRQARNAGTCTEVKADSVAEAA